MRFSRFLDITELTIIEILTNDDLQRLTEALDDVIALHPILPCILIF